MSEKEKDRDGASQKGKGIAEWYMGRSPRRYSKRRE